MLHASIPTSWYKYTTILILKHANALSEVIKSHNVNSVNMTPCSKYTIIKSTCAKYHIGFLLWKKGLKLHYIITSFIGHLIQKHKNI